MENEAKRSKSVGLNEGREEIIEFRQEASIAARYPDRVAYVGSKTAVTGEVSFRKFGCSLHFLLTRLRLGRFTNKEQS